MFISIINSIQKKQTNFSSILVNKKIKDTAFFQQVPLSNTKISCCVSVNFVSNNIYCTFWSISGKRTFRMRSAGMKNFKPSKRRLLFYGKACIESFFKELQQWRKKYKSKGVYLFYSLKLPKRFRKFILNLISSKAAIINFEYNKSFNGCKAKKKRRKKRLGFRRFK